MCFIVEGQASGKGKLRTKAKWQCKPYWKNAKTEIHELKAAIESNEKEFDEMSNNLSAKKKILKFQWENVLKCDDCDEHF